MGSKSSEGRRGFKLWHSILVHVFRVFLPENVECAEFPERKLRKAVVLALRCSPVPGTFTASNLSS